MLVHKYMMKVTSNIVSALASFVALMFMTRYVPDEYGLMMWGFAFVALFNAVADLGFSTAHMKFVASGRDINDCFSTYAVIRVLFASIMILLAVIFTAIGIFDGSITLEAAAVVLVFIVFYTIWDVRSILTTTFDARLESGKASIVLITETVIRSLILVVLAYMQVDAVILSTAYLTGMIFAAIMALVLTRNVGLRFVRPTMLKEYARYSAPLVIATFVLMTVESLDKVLIGFSSGTMEVGYYAAAMGAVVAVIGLGNSINAVLLPQLSSKEMTGSASKTEGLIWTSQKYLLMLLLPMMAVLMVYGEEMASVLFGGGFARAGTMLSILSVLMVLKIMSGILSQVLYASNNAKLHTKATVFYGVLVMVLYLLFIPEAGIFPFFGGIGAAIAIGSGSIAYIIILSYYVKHAAGVRTYPNLWKHVISLIITLVVLILIWYVLDVSGVFWMIFVSMLGMGLYMGVLVVLKELRYYDIKFFMNAINPKQLMKSLDDELH